MADVLTEDEIVELLYNLEKSKEFEESERILTRVTVVLIKNSLNNRDIDYENLLKDINKNIDSYRDLNEKELLEKIKPFIF